MFKIDETGYTEILNQVRTQEFQIEIDKQIGLLKDQKDSAIKLELQKADNDLQNLLHGKDLELSTLKAQADQKIQELSGQLKTQQELLDKEVKLTEEQTKNNYLDQLKVKDLEVAGLKNQIEQIKSSQGLELTEAVSEVEKELNQLKLELTQKETEKELEITKAVSEVEKERDRLLVQLTQKDSERQLKEASLKDQYEVQLKARDVAYEELKKFKTQQSTKMLGENLEQHCEISFNEVRSYSFPKAYFEKDSDISEGTKGDYIFRELDDDGAEIISIMFEMKNQMETTATKHKNQDFFAKLDNDRTKKKCEYAVLVSLLETDNELYNSGIVDVSYQFPKMFVIRPQFFLPLIGILRNAALNSQKYRTELALVKNQNIDISNFETEIADWKQNFGRNYDLAGKKFQTAIDEIDKTIVHLQKTKEGLLGSENQLRLAYQKTEDLSIKRLTKNNPTMKQKFNELKVSKAESNQDSSQDSISETDSP
jgi:hypothetical protein